MKKTAKNIFFSLIASILYGMLTMYIIFYITPELERAPDCIWICFMFIAPAIAVLPLIRASWYPLPVLIFIGIPVQYVFLHMNAEQIARNLLIALQGLSGFRYFFVATTRPIAVTLVQFLVIHFGRKVYSKGLPD